MVVIDSSFIGNFKLGDNINHNLMALAALYAACEASQNGAHKRALCKPICVIAISIIEALLHDLHFKARSFTREGVPGLLQTALDRIRSKRIDKMELLIVSARKDDLLGVEPAFYDELDFLRQVRNRVHIQNVPPRLQPDEHQVFTPAAVLRAEAALERVMRSMASYQRPDHQGYVAPFQLPWEAHHH
ncbi:Hypothetical protein NGAL_HAMBI1145_59660 [Neorhizobium galegae bv. officinalis]|uniref:Uncharacterized protein n=1 Tax=Neorhizobium galegae bv. officinalis TaxID=323656 RepID=A0A0T7G320_NEOGA|nr:hypothetical protein [Neorhizobium galegae]CDZ41587.1 Hypothetical protein NGAL_HAMBI1145_59660 [Neorhizobium galegae bv. officinalis]